MIGPGRLGETVAALGGASTPGAAVELLERAGVGGALRGVGGVAKGLDARADEGGKESVL